MAWRLRFWRRVRVLPGVTVNVSKSGPSLSLGPRGSKVTIGRKGLRQTVGVPGSGLFATSYTPWKSRDEKANPDVGHGAAESEREAAPADLAAEPEGPLVRPSDQSRCDFCGAQAVHGQRCPMCNQPV